MSKFEEMFADPGFLEALDKRFGTTVAERVTPIALPHLRGLVNQLLLQVELCFSKATAGGYLLPASTLDAMRSAWPACESRLGALITRFPALGSSPAEFSTNCTSCLQFVLNSSGEDVRNDDQHMQGVEDVLQELHALSNSISFPQLRDCDVFLHVLVVSADDLVREFLAVPRLVKLASLALQCSKDQIYYHPERKWTWQKTYKPDKVQQFIDIIMDVVPDLAANSDAFRGAADSLSEQAAQFGLVQLHYPPHELQQRVVRCLNMGIFSTQVQEDNPFAYAIVTHLDIFLSVEV